MKVAVYLVVLSTAVSCVQNAPVLTAKRDRLDSLMEQLLASPDLMDELYSRINNFRAHFNPMSYQQDSRVTGRMFMNNRWSHRNSEKREPVTQDYDIRRAYLARKREERFRVPQELKEAASVNSDNRLPLEINSDYL